MDDRKGNGLGMLLAFVGGAAVGGLTALLLAPKSGRETREGIAKSIRNGTDTTKRIPSAVKEAGGAAKEAFSKALDH